MGRIWAAALALTLVAHADLSAQRVVVKRAEFVTHPGIQPIPYLLVRVTLRDPAACAGELVAMLGEQAVGVTRTPEGFSGNVQPKPRRSEETQFADEGAALRISCGGGPLHDTGIAFHSERLLYEGW